VDSQSTIKQCVYDRPVWNLDADSDMPNLVCD
jgi:hypothetical protein